MPAAHVTDAEFSEKVIQSKLPVLVDFYADWCGPCKQAAPVLDELADTLADKFTILKLDVDSSAQTAATYGVMSIPTVILFKEGKEVSRKVGFPGKAGYEAMLK